MTKYLKRISSDLLALGLIASTSVCLGTLLNQFRDQPLSLIYRTKEERLERSVSVLAVNEVSTPLFIQAPPPQIVSIDDFRAFVEGSRGIVLDARPEIFYRLGHVPGALSLPRDDFENGYARMKDRLAARPNQPLVVYCSSSSCADSELVRRALESLGYEQVAVFRAGWDAWTRAGLREEKSE